MLLLLLLVVLAVLLLFCFPPLPEWKSPSLLPAFELLVLAARTFLEHPTKPCRHTPTSLSFPPAVSARCMSTCAEKWDYITGSWFSCAVCAHTCARTRCAWLLLKPLSPISCCRRQLGHLSLARAEAVPREEATAVEEPQGQEAVKDVEPREANILVGAGPWDKADGGGSDKIKRGNSH